MKYYEIPHFIIKKNSQKGEYTYQDILKNNILEDICKKLTNKENFTVEFDERGYNKGRLAILYYKDRVNYISFSETGKIKGRNYFFQSITTALVHFYKEQNENKRICFYLLECEGNIETNYYKFMYRLMATAGIEFINSDRILKEKISKFLTVDDILATRILNKSTNRSNNSTYLTRSKNGIIEIYAKTYGANKKEAVLITIAASHLVSKIILYEITEQNLKKLPIPDKEMLLNLKNIEIVNTDMLMERIEFEKENSLRSPRFIYNLLERIGPKKCALCDCEIPELIEGAHIWAVSDIKNTYALAIDDKIKYAIDGNNGLWLCENHHKMFDEGLLQILKDGTICIKRNMEEKDKKFINKVTTVQNLSSVILSQDTSFYLEKRYQTLKTELIEYDILK